jgi:nicotinate-nucleotide adenylyltransferase
MLKNYRRLAIEISVGFFVIGSHVWVMFSSFVDLTMKIGLFGGSFDPVHLGHLLVARAALEELALTRLFFIPAAQSPFKANAAPTPAALRLQMLRLALAGETTCEIDDLEIDRGGLSYTVDTLRHYADKYAGAELFYLIGSDQAALLPQWREAGELARLAEFVVVPRLGQAPPEIPPPFRGRTLRGIPNAISSTEIQARRRAGLPITHLTPPAVAEAIANNRLYLSPGNG